MNFIELSNSDKAYQTMANNDADKISNGNPGMIGMIMKITPRVSVAQAKIL
jgi:hypothetical protein